MHVPQVRIEYVYRQNLLDWGFFSQISLNQLDRRSRRLVKNVANGQPSPTLAATRYPGDPETPNPRGRLRGQDGDGHRPELDLGMRGGQPPG